MMSSNLTEKIDRIWWCYHFENNENMKLPIYLGNDMKCETVIWYLEVVCDADSDYATEIQINWQNYRNLMMSSLWRQMKT